MDNDDNEWELSKENVQPLRQGRHISSLVAALHSDQGDEHKIKTQQNAFELELRTYDGDDPFDVWDRYIKWTEQHFPKGGHDGQLMKLIERCLKEFQADTRYVNDPRFIRVWIKFACFSEEPVDVFAYMFDNGIGVNVAAFYVEWAITLERKGDNKRSDAIYIEGLNRCAEPKDLLLQRQQQFQTRVARNINLQIAENQSLGMSTEEEVEKRSALGRLKASGTSHKVGSSRVGAVKLGAAGSLKDKRPAAPKQVPSRGIPIFRDDENVPPSLQPQQTNEWQSMPTRAVDNRENDKKPGVWTDVKVKQRPGAVPHAAPGIPFQIHEDPESEGLPQQTPRKTTLINTQPLSSRKAAQAHTDVLSNIRQPQGAPALNSGIPMYQKDKIYNGVSEFSFEELRAVKYWKLKKKKEAEEERKLKEEEQKLKDEMMMQQLQAANTKIAAMEALLRAQFGGININRAQQGGTQENMDTGAADGSSSDFVTPPNVTAIPPSNEIRGASSDGKANGSLNSSQRTPIFNTVSAYSKPSSGDSSLSWQSTSRQFEKNTSINVSSTKPTVSGVNTSMAGRSRMSTQSTRTPVDAASNNPSLSNQSSSGNVFMPTPMNIHQDPPSGQGNISTTTPVNVDHVHSESSYTSSGSLSSHCKVNRTTTPKSGGPTPESTNSFSMKRGPISAPSPTVHTKEAMQCVMGMFSSSFACDNQTSTEEMDSFMAPAPPVSAAKAPFQIREDTTSLLPGKQNPQSGAGKTGPQIYCDNPESTTDTSSACKMPFQILEDSSSHNAERQTFQSTQKKGLHVAGATASSLKTPAASSQGLQIFCDESENKGNEMKCLSNKKGARRGLGFIQPVSSENIEMTDMEKEVDVMFQQLNHDFTIECQARNDVTLAPLDSFSIQARAASTPCITGQKSRVPPQEMSETASSCSSTSVASTVNYSEADPCPDQHLSPIMEGSGEGSGEDTKSSYQHSTAAVASGSFVTTRSRHGSSKSSDPIQEEEEAQDPHPDVVMHDDHLLDRSCHHEIDTTAYIHDPDEKTEALLSASICLDPKNPFDEETIAYFLKTLDPPISEYPNYVTCAGQLPDLSMDLFLQLENSYVCVDECIGEGGYAKVYKVSTHPIGMEDTTVMECSMDGFNNQAKVIKVQTPASYWEFYAVCELRNRLGQLGAPMNILPSIMEIEKGFFFENGSALQMVYAPAGTILNLVNRYKNRRSMLTDVEPLACLLTIELLHMFEQIHKCGFIHGDVKPDNFLLSDLPQVKDSRDPKIVFGSQVRLVQLIDFGQSIDMTKFPNGTTFMSKVATSGFQCIEMRTDRPWTFQTDLFGLAGTIHVVLFGSYMNVFQEHGVWRVTGSFVRKWNVPLWKRLFQELLNIPSCHQQPNLAALRGEFENHFMQNLIPNYNSWIKEMNQGIFLEG